MSEVGGELRDARCVGPSGLEIENMRSEAKSDETEDSDTSYRQVVFDWICDRINEHIGEPCLASFPSHRALPSHARKAHSLRDEVALLTATNQCMVCFSTFSLREVAISHVKRSLERQGQKRVLNKSVDLDGTA